MYSHRAGGECVFGGFAPSRLPQPGALQLRAGPDPWDLPPKSGPSGDSPCHPRRGMTLGRRDPTPVSGEKAPGLQSGAGGGFFVFQHRSVLRLPGAGRGGRMRREGRPRESGVFQRTPRESPRWGGVRRGGSQSRERSTEYPPEAQPLGRWDAKGEDPPSPRPIATSTRPRRIPPHPTWVTRVLRPSGQV
jgi:hypothetical protein